MSQGAIISFHFDDMGGMEGHVGGILFSVILIPLLAA